LEYFEKKDCDIDKREESQCCFKDILSVCFEEIPRFYHVIVSVSSIYFSYKGIPSKGV